MAVKFARLLKEREINYNTNEIWKLEDVPKLWRSKTEKLVLSDGYIFLEDGTAVPKPKEDTGVQE